MVKNSKYLMLMLGLVVSLSLKSQGNGNFNAIQRDMEVTRVTFENFLKKWSEEPLLNIFKDSEASYQSGRGITIKLLAENARIYMSVHNGTFKNADEEIMDTFFSDDMVNLQKERLKSSISKFLIDFKSYLPQLQASERLQFIMDVKDSPEKNKPKEETSPTPMEYKRTYTLEASVPVTDFENFKNGSITAEAFKAKINFEIK